MVFHEYKIDLHIPTCFISKYIYFRIVCMETLWTYKEADDDSDRHTDLNSAEKG